MAMLDKLVRKHKKIEISGKEFSFAKLTIADMAEFSAWVKESRRKGIETRKKRMIEEAEKIGGIDPMELLKEVERPPTEEEIEDEMYTAQGLGFLIQKSLQPAYLGITLEEAMGLVEMDKVVEIMTFIMGETEEEVKKKQQAEANRRKKVSPSK